jgi:hypothetical protein
MKMLNFAMKYSSRYLSEIQNDYYILFQLILLMDFKKVAIYFKMQNTNKI